MDIMTACFLTAALAMLTADPPAAFAIQVASVALVASRIRVPHRGGTRPRNSTVPPALRRVWNEPVACFTAAQVVAAGSGGGRGGGGVAGAPRRLVVVAGRRAALGHAVRRVNAVLRRARARPGRGVELPNRRRRTSSMITTRCGR